MAVNTPKALARTAAATTSATLYTVPASTIAVVTSIAVVNTTASAQAAYINLDGVPLVGGTSIPANTTLLFETKQVLAATKLITGYAGSTSVFFHISGMEIA